MAFAFIRQWSMRLGGWPRRALALVLVIAAAFSATAGHRGRAATRPPPRTPVLVAARDIPGGVPLQRAAVRIARLPASLVPAGALRSADAAVGRTVGAPLRRGEPITDVRLVGTALAASLAGTGAVAAPVRLVDADTAALLRPGDAVDVLAAPQHGDSGSARVVAPDARVMAVPPPDPDSTVDGALVVLAMSENAARTVAAAATSGQITVTLRANR
jgi:pilus assembly protein CpaB